MDWIAGKRDWRQFWRFKDQLGPGSRYLSKLLMDPELAEEWAKQPIPVATSPSMAGWTPLISKLTDLEDQLIALRASFSAEGAAEVKFVERPVPLYVQARERLRKNISREKRHMALSQLLPGQEV